MENSNYDLVIVGLGVTGGMFLQRLLAYGGGRRIAVVEAGRMWDPTEAASLKEKGHIRDTASTDDRPIKIRYGSGDSLVRRWWAPKLAGGGSLLWYGQLHRFDKFDTSPMLLEKYLNANNHELRNWPVTADEFSIYYDEVCNYLRPFAVEASSAEVANGVRLRGKKSGLESTVYRHLLEKINRGVNFPLSCIGGIRWDNFPFDPVSNTYRLDTAPLAVRPNIFTKICERLREESTVTVLDNCITKELLHKHGKVSGVSIIDTRSNSEKKIYSPIVVLACGAIESIRLTLVSKIESNYAIGAGFTFTNEATRYIETDIKREQSEQEDGLESFASISAEDAVDYEGALRGKFSIYNAKCFETADRFLASTSLAPAHRNSYFCKADEKYFLKISFKGESVPWSKKRVKLSPSYSINGIRLVQIDYELHQLDREIISNGIQRIGEIAKALDGRVLPAAEIFDYSSAHQHGGLIFGKDAENSVLSVNCEAHGCSGLFVIDGSFMPTSGHTNSTWTLLANALRVADLIENRS